MSVYLILHILLYYKYFFFFFFFSSRRRHTRCSRDWSSDVCSSDLIPLAYHPDHNELGEALGRTGTATSGFDDLKNIAGGRLLLDNVPHVKTHWPMVTPFISQVALTFGCDDLEGTGVFERVSHEAGAGTPIWLSN